VFPSLFKHDDEKEEGFIMLLSERVSHA